MKCSFLLCCIIILKSMWLMPSDQFSWLAGERDTDNYKVVKEGFELCGRYDLEEFLNEKKEKFITNKDGRDYYNFEVLIHAIKPAQNVIVKAFKQDEIFTDKFHKMLSHIINNNLDLYSDSITSYFHRTTPHHITDRFFQYCITVDFMKPVVRHYILNRFRAELCTLYNENKPWYKLAWPDSRYDLFFIKQDLSRDMCNFLCSRYSCYRDCIKKNNPQIMQFFITIGLDFSDIFIVEYAIKHGAMKIIPLVSNNLVSQNNEGNNPLHKAIISHNENLALAYGYVKSFINARNNNGDTPLHLAINEKNYKFIPILLAAECNLSIRNNNGDTPLHNLVSIEEEKESFCCIPFGKNVEQKKAISLLIAHGASLSTKNNNGQTPWNCAVNEEIRDLLKAKIVV